MIFKAHRLWIVVVLCVLAGGAVFAWNHMRMHRLETELLSLPPDAVPQRPDLVRFAAAQAKPVYAAHCASCHGADLTGDTRLGAPNLADGVWLYGSGRVFDIEQTILHGIRSGDVRGHDVTDMTAFGQTGALTPGEIRDAVQYVLALSHKPYLTEGAVAGRAIFNGKGSCDDCHGPDGRGNADYGAPNLTINVWNNGGDAASLYHSIYYGVRHICPAWYGVIPLDEIRMLAVYIYSASHSGSAQPSPAH